MTFEILHGTWRSVKDISVKYNFENFCPTEAQMAFYENVFGILTLTYSESEIREHYAPKVKYNVNGKSVEFGFDDRTYPYRVVSTSSKNVVIEFEDSFAGTMVNSIHFENNDLYYASLGEPENHREYFERIL